MERFLDSVPSGYAGQNPPGVLKPPGMVQPQSAAVEQQPVEGDAVQVVEEQPTPPPEPILYNKNVSVFPLDQDFGVGVADMEGSPVQKVFFEYGSSVIKSADKKDMKGLARGTGAKSFAVVGHASQRVDGVTDPVQKKLINFEMAQKRARAVAKELQKNGVAAGKVVAISKGDTEPNAAPGGMPQEEADRRVEIFASDSGN